VVRTIPAKGDTVLWLRCFGGTTFLESVYSRAASAPPDLHEVESVWPLDFRMDFVVESERRVRLAQRETTMLGVLPWPRWLVSLDLTLDLHDDDAGWDLRAFVTALGGTVPLMGYEGSMRPVAEEVVAARYVPGFHHLLLFDGECNLCNASVDFVLRHDRQQRFVFCTQQSPAASELLAAHGHSLPALGHEDDSVLLLTADGKLHDNSAAALRVGAELRWPLSWLGNLGLAVPSSLRDAVYAYVGRRRYAWFGKSSTCRLPTPAERSRFL